MEDKREFPIIDTIINNYDNKREKNDKYNKPTYK